MFKKNINRGGDLNCELCAWALHTHTHAVTVRFIDIFRIGIADMMLCAAPPPRSHTTFATPLTTTTTKYADKNITSLDAHAAAERRQIIKNRNRDEKKKIKHTQTYRVIHSLRRNEKCAGSPQFDSLLCTLSS